MGYKYFGKKNYFNIPTLYSYNLKKKLKKIVIEYIDGDKISFLDFFKIYKKKYFKKKIPISKHILYLKKKYNFNNSFFIENKILYNFLKNQKSIFVYKIMVILFTTICKKK